MVQKVMVWDLFVRLFHWSLVTIVVLNLFVVSEGSTIHQYLGYGACVLVALRIVWGFVGTRYARFSDFFPTPARFKAHLLAMKNREPETHLGHNPMGALMIFALIAVIFGLGITGWAQTMDSPYYIELWPLQWHRYLVNTLQVLVVLHVLAVVVMSVLHKTDLVGAMITGRKKQP